MAGEGGFSVGGQPVDLTPAEVGQIRRVQLIMVVAAISGGLAFLVIITWLGPFEGLTLLAIGVAAAAPAFLSFLLFRRRAMSILDQAARRGDRG